MEVDSTVGVPSFCVHLTRGLDQLCKRNAHCAANLQSFLAKQIWSPADRQTLLNLLAEKFVEFSCTEDVCWSFRPIILEIVYRAETFLLSQTKKPPRDLCIAISKTFTICPNLKGLAKDYLDKYGLFLDESQQDMPEPVKKKRKQDNQNKHTISLEVCQAAWRFMKHSVGSLPLHCLLPYLNHRHTDIRWFALLTVSQETRMSPAQKEQLKDNLFSADEKRQLCIRHEEIICASERVNRGLHQPVCEWTVLGGEEKYTRHGVVTSDLSDRLVAVGGVILSRLSPLQSQMNREHDGLVMVGSTQANLRSLSLAVSAGRPVLLQGPVGSGKTSLVEELARLTGRSGSPHFIKLQLGDQTDSKALLGTYRCTEVAGEFVWQPGVLTQAVTGGHWLLLEDIDSAPMDILSELLPLLETGSLAGHGQKVEAAPGFRIFFTQRILQGTAGWHSQSGSQSAILRKLWRQINVEPLSRRELAEVITGKYPQLSTVVERLLAIYFLLSSGGHVLGDNPATTNTLLSPEGRLISTRDLMTWCRRSAVGFEVSSPESAVAVFQNALDCFCANISNPDKQLAVANVIATNLNITHDKAEYYCCKHKPMVEFSPLAFSVGRVRLQKLLHETTVLKRPVQCSFAFTRQSAMLLERVAVCVSNCEPVLLVGETGTGKTSSIQYLAQHLGHTLRVINMNQQSDSSDLLGGYKPVDVRHVVRPFKDDFELLFCQTFSRTQNVKFLQHVQECFGKRRWSDLFTLLEHTQRAAIKKTQSDPAMLTQWVASAARLQVLRQQVTHTQRALAFTFIEGTLVKALRAGDWVLLDEINLASAETLECLSSLLESTTGSVLLAERGDTEPIVRHENFRLFACMNPATDVGKKDLPLGIRNRFTELYVDEELSVSDLTVLTAEYLRGLSLSASQLDGIVRFYLSVRREAQRKLTDGTGHKPHFSLRTLCRGLRYAAGNPCGHVTRSLYEGFCMSFLTQLDRASHPIVQKLICQHVLPKTSIKALLGKPLPEPPGGQSVNIEGYWIRVGAISPSVPDNYILTPSVRANLKDLARIVSAGHHPVLLQGETSVGKTSLVSWLARATGHQYVRVNNHEHTDLQEYVGSYTADNNGKLTFKEGVLVDAMRRGHWIILDELNLAPSDVLEALNRLLDDNRELFIPETQETVKAHAKFMLFATQNPPGQYGGRKILSRAFRNRFIELHFDEIPSKELETILHKRCDLPLSYGRKLVAVMLELQRRRRGSSVFAGKQGFMTLRDLFRWANRYQSDEGVTKRKFYDWDQHMADHGYMLLAGRVRKPEEGALVQEVIQKYLKRSVDPENLFTFSKNTSATTAAILSSLVDRSVEGFEHIVWTLNMRRLAVLVGQAIKYKEPVLLVGDTGCGKTTVCQLLAALQATPLHTINCHMHSESADFLGGLRPVRSRNENQDGDQRLFEWVDGPLVLAMKQGHMCLIDEISLADDSVLERLNSVLEPERSLLLAEKGGSEAIGKDVEEITAAEEFQAFATMNPGGDYGKKELSPALRNRFTEVWCDPVSGRGDLVSIVEHNLHTGLQLCNQEDCTTGIGRAMVDFVTWFTSNDFGRRVTVSVRDYLSWTHFMNACGHGSEEGPAPMGPGSGKLDPAQAYIHGACLVFLDALGSGISRYSGEALEQTREQCLCFLTEQVNCLTGLSYSPLSLGILRKESSPGNSAVILDENTFSIPPFSIAKGDAVSESDVPFTLHAPTPCVNAQRVLRALQLPRPLLLEGAPGVGKTSLVTALARAAGRQIVRINLSEQTDVSDLFGADLPVEGAGGGVFAWRDGPLLQALKHGHWVVLDELNLASQSVLEGLNACLDHRAEVYVPELGRSFPVRAADTRIFACQNPLHQGGGRKGLPRSFLNRFTQVYIEPLSRSDLLFISSTMYPRIPEPLLAKMVDFNTQLHQTVMVEGQWGQRGAPWEFNLRDLFRWCDLIVHFQIPGQYDIGQFVNLLYRDRLRTSTDKQQVFELFQTVCPQLPAPYSPGGAVKISPHHIQINQSFLPRHSAKQASSNHNTPLYLLHHSLGPLESLMKCVEMKWMAILVGQQASGKTSLVKLLSRLTGSALHVLPVNSAMDTTELLGGFEQADLSRDLEEVSEVVGEAVRSLCVVTLLTGVTADTVEALTKTWLLWEKYIGITNQAGKTSSGEELKTLRTRTNHLLVLVHNLDKQSVCTDEMRQRLGKCKEDLTRLSGRLEQQSASRGGTFEWIDSVLVKALQHGHWLLIDNVNFCSASVLDRLNALLEPNGVLSINERGVIDGQVPVIKPHPDFRLFMSMDPRFGEISRAMRNRGVEIYILGEEEGGSLDSLDMKTVLHGIGLVGNGLTDWLISLHEDMRLSLIGGERPTIQDLFNMAVLVRQEVERGLPLDDALRRSSRDVYVQGLKTMQSKKLAVEVLNQRLEELPVLSERQQSVCPELGIYPVPPVCVESYSRDSSLAASVKAASLLVHAVKKLHRLFEASKGDSSSVENSQEIQEALVILKHSMKLYLEQTTIQDWQLSLVWLKKFMANREVTATEIQLWLTKHGVTDQQNLLNITTAIEILSRVLEAIFTSQAAEEYNSLLQSLKPDLKNVLLFESYDPRWNPQCLTNVLRQIARDVGSQQAQTINSSIECCQNRLYLCEVVTLRRLMEEHWAAHLSQRDRSPLGLSYIYHQGTQGWGSLGQPALPHLYPLATRGYAYLHDLLPNIRGLDDNKLLQVLECYQWFVRLLEFSKRPPPQGGIRSALPLLQLHWNWFYNRTLPVLAAVTEKPLPDDLDTVLLTLNNILGQESSGSKRFLKVWHVYCRPRRLGCQREAEIGKMVRTVCQFLQKDVSWEGNCRPQPVVLATRMAVAACEKLLGVESQLEEVESQLEKIKTFLSDQNCGIAEPMETDSSGNEAPPGAVSCLTNEISATAKFLFELVGLLVEQQLHMDGSQDLERVEQFSNYCLQRSQPDPMFLSLLKKIQTSTSEEAWSLSVSGLLISLNRLWAGPRGADHNSQIMSVGSQGPAMLQLSPLSRLSFHLLCPEEVTKAPNSSQQVVSLIKISLADFNETQSTLQDIHQLLWMHTPVFSSQSFDLRVLERSRAALLLYRLLRGLTNLLPSQEGETWTTAVENLWQLRTLEVSESLRKTITSSLATILGVTATDLLLKCVEMVFKLFRSVTFPPLQDIGTLWVYTGLLQTLLLSPTGPVDPVVKLQIKLQYVDEELKDIGGELSVRDTNQQLLTGTCLDETRTDLLHPRVVALFRRRRELQLMKTKLETQRAYRPDPPKFEPLLQDVTNYQKTNGDPGFVLSLLDRLLILSSAIGRGVEVSKVNSQCLSEERVWQASLGKLLLSLTHNYPEYCDLLEPFLLGISQMRHGMRLVGGVTGVDHQRELCRVQLPKTIQVCTTRETWLEDVMLTLGKFPSIGRARPDLLSVCQRLSSPDFLKTVKCLTEEGEQTSGENSSSHSIISSILLSALHYLHQGAVSRSSLSTEVLNSLSQLLDMFVTMWSERETNKRLKEEEEATLYRYKGTTYGQDLTQDEQDEIDFKKSFPLYDQDFADVIDKNELGDGDKKWPESEEVSEGDISLSVISDEEMSEVWQNHHSLFASLTQSDWLEKQPMKTTVADDLQPVTSCYQVAAELGRKTVDKMYYGVDKDLVGGHLAMVYSIKQSMVPLEKGTSEKAEHSKDLYDIYHDPNIPEVTKCRPVLERFRSRVRELQSDWPDHPTLKQLMIITERILSFRVTCPLMKFLSGLELLLQKSQDWESNAARHVSLTSQLQEVTDMIVEWRKLELRCWSQSMETVLVRCRQKASRWWFHIYQLIQAVLTEESCGKVDQSSKKTTEEVVMTLTQFVEGSPLGEFPVRLDMLYAFHCQLTFHPQSTEQKWLLHLLWNLYQFYLQFLPSVTEELSKQRMPIEKELKGFVKIARWHDINYWALKQTTEKTHRTVHKHIKAFQAVLSQPVKRLLVEATSVEGEDNSVNERWSAAVKSYTMEVKQQFQTLYVLQPSDPASVSDRLPLQSRLPVLCRRMNTHCVRIATTGTYPDDIVTMEEFTRELIEAIQELQALEVDKTVDQDKQKSLAKNINLRKRKALSDLFKTLADLGLSYRRGLTMKTEELQRDSLDSTPVDITTLSKKFNRNHGTLSKLWERCSHYYYRSMSRRAQLLAALETPSQELGVANIERCRGFAEQMMSILLHKHRDLAQLASSYSQLLGLVRVFDCVRAEGSTSQSLPPQAEARQWLSKIKQLFLTTKEGLDQFKIVLQCCPDQTSTPDMCMSPLQKRLLSQAANMRKGDDKWQEFVQTIQKISSSTYSSYSALSSLDGKQLIFWSDIETTSKELVSLRGTVPMMEAVSMAFCDPKSESPCCLNEVLDFLCCEIKDKADAFEQWKSGVSEESSPSVPSDRVQQIAQLVEDMLEAILLVIQNLTKKSNHATDETEKLNEKSEDGMTGLKEKHLTESLGHSLKQDLAILNCNKITTQLCNILDQLRDVYCERGVPSDDGQVSSCGCLQLIGRCVPVMEQYTALVEYYLAQVICTYRTVGKLLSVLLKLFIDLALKGFCLPAELSGEMDESGATEFEDIEGGGLGEGEGARDVSDQIETEDQLHDTQKAGDQQEEDDSTQPDVQSEDNAIEMTDDFEGKMHDLDQAAEGEESDGDSAEEDQLDKQMGDVEGDEADKLDDQMWGSDDEQQQQDGKEEVGPGAGKQSESELVAKDDVPDKTERDGDTQPETQQEPDEKEQQQHDLQQLDETEYDDNKVDPHSERPQEEPPSDLDLPDDLQLDEQEAGEGSEEQAPEQEEIDNTIAAEDVTEPQEDGSQPMEEDKDGKPEDKGDNSEAEQDQTEEEPAPQMSEGQAASDDVLEAPTDTPGNEDGTDNEGISPQDKAEEVPHEDALQSEEAEKADIQGETSHGVDNTEQSDTAKDRAGTSENNQDESEGTGQSTSQLSEGHEGQTSQRVTRGGTNQELQQKQPRQPGVSDSDRSLGSVDEKYKRLITQETSTQEDSQEKAGDTDLYEHIKDAESQSDAQTLDVATTEQQEEQPVPNMEMGEEPEPMEEGEAESIRPDDSQEENQNPDDAKDIKPSKVKGVKTEDSKNKGDKYESEGEESQQYQTSGEPVLTMRVGRGPQSTIHTALEHLTIQDGVVDVERVRAELEGRLAEWRQPQTLHTAEEAREAWFHYEVITASLSQELCEQLRLVLEPTQATKLRGDYRTGKRLNMRKVIPYIASEFRKDKIWLRRTKPSKRQYQILLAMDDSASMTDNHSKQLAFESLAVMANALTLLEAGQLGICSFGESVKVLHPFTEQFTSQSGARILQQFTFEQKKTKIAQLLKEVTGVMLEARSKIPGAVNHSETAQLLLVVSDGRGLFLEGMDVVKSAVRQARAANIFLVFVVIDNPQCKDSILDIKVPFFKEAGQLPEIQSYMDHFPFPFYLILRDINSLPATLSDALRQWFELVTAADR